MNLFEKLNRLDDSLVESKRVVNKKKLTESLQKKHLKENYQISDKTWNNIKNYADLETTTGRDFAYDGPYADEVGSLYGTAIDRYNELEGTNVEYQASIQNGRGASELFDDQGGHAYRDFETECDELLEFAREATCLEDFMSSLVNYIYSFAEDLEYEEEDYDDYDDDIDEMLTEAELTDREKLMKTFPDDFGHWSRRPANKTSAQHKTMNDYARDPNTPTYDNKGVTTSPAMSTRDKLLKTFPDLNIRSSKDFLKENMSDKVRDFVVNNIELIENNDFETVCREADRTLTTEQVYQFLDVLKDAGIVTIKYNPNADVYEDEQMFEIDYSSIPKSEPVKTSLEHDAPKQAYSNEAPKNVDAKPTELSYEQLKDEYPHSLVKDVNTYIKDNKDLLKTDVLTFFNNALKKFPYKDFIDNLVYIVVNKLKINIFDSHKYNIPLLIAKQYKERYKNISAKIDAEHAKEEQDKKALEQSKKEEKKKLILKDINSGSISDLRYLQLITEEKYLFNIIDKNNLIYKAYRYDMSMSDSVPQRISNKTAVLLLIRSKGQVYMLFVGKTESDLKRIIARSRITTKPHDSINDARRYYSGPIGDTTGDGVKDTTSVKSASVSYNDLLKYGHANRRDNYQNKYNNQDYWEND